MLHERHEGVGRRGVGAEVAPSRRLEERFRHFRTVRQRVDHEVDLAVVRLDLLRDFGDRVPIQAGVALVGLRLLRDILRGVEDRIERVDLVDVHGSSTRQLAVGVHLAALERLLEDGEDRRPGAHNNLAARLGQRLGDGPAVARAVGDARDERDLAGEVALLGRRI